MLKFVLHDAIGYVRHNVREFSLNALRLLPQLPQLSPYDVSIDPAKYRSMYSTLPLMLLLLFAGESRTKGKRICIQFPRGRHHTQL